MNRNPFSSKTYTSTWLRHFYSNGREISFPFLNGTSFYKLPFFPLYMNVGRNLTKGISYTFSKESLTKEAKNKVLLIYDVPEYMNKSQGIDINKKYALDSITQYPGFLIDLKSFQDINNYMSATFSKSSRYKLNKYKKKLESCFNIKYKMYHGHINKDEYDHIFDEFEKLLRKRFLQKEITNNNLDPKEWNFYKDVTYPMILENDATLFVTYNENQIIGVTLNYIHSNTLIDAITVFDVDYSKFNLGSVNIMKLIEWCLENKFDKLDFSKGYFDYKKRWSNLEYKFEYHLIYNKNAILPRTIAFVIKNYFRAKQYLRDKKLNDRIHKIKFLLNKNSTKQNVQLGFTFEELTELSTNHELKEIFLSTEKNHSLKTALFEYLYLNNESISNLRTFKVFNTEDTYIFQTESKTTKVQLER
ncbi:GNAT family N-acetyltransferase [Arenibacter sp. S6351L]|uniref:GNAT family N-acetyltransferase n=1 Tax=Arenibacter sp. S6351L TaxID=2926407 RepID=UPI001FF1173A|nr:GNAT family N-acetyltransferase [Arenibacter sp. S6351L]MCK0136993.1 GNAT family N-acetyltransferase [Arenibacter sp. S6351L]